jgi:hypothetical protein
MSYLRQKAAKMLQIGQEMSYRAHRPHPESTAIPLAPVAILRQKH